MFPEFLYPLTEYFTPFNVFQYITFRGAYAAITALLISFIAGPGIIAFLRRKEAGEEIRADGVPLEVLSHPLERDLIKRLSDFPEMVARATQARSPHTVCEYLEQTAGAVNAWYHAGNPSRSPELAVLVEDPELRQARLVLARGVQIVLRNGLALLGVSAPTRMERDQEVQDG